MRKAYKLLLCLFLFFVCLPQGEVFASDMVDINTASLQQLDTLSGIGPTYAQRIIDGRPYSSVDDLLRVKGIGPITLQKIKNQGLACVNCSSAQIDQSSQQAPPQTQTAVQDQSQQTQQTQQVQQNPTSQQTIDSSQPTGQTQTKNSTSASSTASAQTLNANYPSGILINEILPNPAGADETNEWIELYNTNNFEVDLSGWKIRDSMGTITTFTFPAGVKIEALGYLVLKRPDTKIMLNNSGDGLNLFSPDGTAMDSMEFVNAPLGFSYNLTSSGWRWSSKLTPYLANIVINNPAAKKAAAASSAQKTADKNNADDKTTAALVNDLPEEKPFSFLLFSGILLAVILGIIFFIIIIKIKTPDKSA